MSQLVCGSLTKPGFLLCKSLFMIYLHQPMDDATSEDDTIMVPFKESQWDVFRLSHTLHVTTR
jgi:hypothetical protein